MQREIFHLSSLTKVKQFFVLNTTYFSGTAGQCQKQTHVRLIFKDNPLAKESLGFYLQSLEQCLEVQLVCLAIKMTLHF